MNLPTEYLQLNNCPLCNCESEHKHVLVCEDNEGIAETHHLKVGCCKCELQLRFELEKDLNDIPYEISDERYQEAIQENFHILQEKWNILTKIDHRTSLINANRIMRIIANELKHLHHCKILCNKSELSSEHLMSFVAVDAEFKKHIIVRYHNDDNYFSITSQTVCMNIINNEILYQTMHPDCRPYVKFSFGWFCINKLAPIPTNSNIHYMVEVPL